MRLTGSIAGLAALGGLCLFAFAARAEVPKNGVAYMDASYQAVISLTQAPRGKPALPRLSDPVEGKVLDDVWNVPAILGKSPYLGSDIPALLQILQQQAQLLTLYSRFSPDAPDKPDLAANATEYQDELTRGHEFVLRNVAAALEAVNNFGVHLTKEERTAERFQGIAQMRAGLQTLTMSAAQSLRTKGLRPENQLRLARAISENAQAIAAGLAPAARTALVTEIQAANAGLRPDGQKLIAQAVKSITSEPCNGLCRLE